MFWISEKDEGFETTDSKLEWKVNGRHQMWNIEKGDMICKIKTEKYSHKVKKVREEK